MMKFVSLPVPLFCGVFGSKFLIKSKCSILVPVVLLPVQRTFMTIVTRRHWPELSRWSVLSSCISMSTSSSNISREEREQFEKWLLHAKYQGLAIPDNIPQDKYDHLIELGHHQRLKYLWYLSVTQSKKAWHLERRVKKRDARREDKERRDKLQPGHIHYGLWYNNMFGSVNSKDLANLYHERLASARMHQLPVIFDMGFDEHMNQKELTSLSRQIILSICLNRENRNPLSLSLCNVDFSSRTFKFMRMIMPSLDSVPIEITSKTYMDLYPKEKLVYLTSNAKDEMTFFDPESIYIIGGIVDLGSAHPFTLSKARKEGIRTQKIPLNRYHQLNHDHSYGLHVMSAILLDLKNTGSWRKAFVNIPRRLIKTGTEEHHERWNQFKPKFA